MSERVEFLCPFCGGKAGVDVAEVDGQSMDVAFHVEPQCQAFRDAGDGLEFVQRAHAKTRRIREHLTRKKPDAPN